MKAKKQEKSTQSSSSNETEEEFYARLGIEKVNKTGAILITLSKGQREAMTKKAALSADQKDTQQETV